MSWIAALPLLSCQASPEGALVEHCSDGADNDADGLYDCAEELCANLPVCGPESSPQQPLGPLFVEVSDAAGLRPDGPQPQDLGGGGAAVADVNGDGWPDIYLCGRVGPQGATPNRLFINDGKGSFADQLELWGLPNGTDASTPDEAIPLAATFADYDNDGDPDLFLANDGANQLYQNQGERFIEVTAEAGLGGHSLLSSGMALGDYDSDGLLDLLVIEHQDLSLSPKASFQQRPADRLYRNLGDGSFTEVQQLLPEPNPRGAGFAAAWLDVDDDGDLDLYVANDYGALLQSNQLYRNNGSAATHEQFTSISSSCGCSLAASSMGIASGDYNRDGKVDLYITNLMLDGGEVLLQGQGDGSFVDATQGTGAIAGMDGIRESSWGSEFGDFDNDGWPDLAVAFGSWEEQLAPAASVLMKNVGGRFEEAQDSGLEDSIRESEGLVRLDYDRDGCLDLLVANLDGPPDLWRNHCTTSHNWIGLDLLGQESNADGVGATVLLTAGSRTSRIDVGAGSSSVHSSSSKSVHFGLGSADSAELIEVRWPSGRRTELQDMPGNQYHRVLEIDGLVP
ncbi:MAG: hypothetical protein CMP23_00535 [Rickettsiales bacterium]|nr:hypothetical protein [Rickettsiales bacterium]|tara:strand:+ start:768 stop:2468 length:1701 start_codon:yes stop_codon:yes gene_type:complete